MTFYGSKRQTIFDRTDSGSACLFKGRLLCWFEYLYFSMNCILFYIGKEGGLKLEEGRAFVDGREGKVIGLC